MKKLTKDEQLFKNEIRVVCNKYGVYLNYTEPNPFYIANTGKYYFEGYDINLSINFLL